MAPQPQAAPQPPMPAASPDQAADLQ
jgi:hypothetical protein